MYEETTYIVREGHLQEGDKVRVDDGFDCITGGAIRIVKRDPGNMKLYIDCKHGEHYLDGQLSSFYVGIKKI